VPDAEKTRRSTKRRTPLTRERVLGTAIALADERGVAELTMRKLATALGVEAMSLYHHIGGKEQLLDELADWVFSRIRTPEIGSPWRDEMRARARSQRETLSAHPWGLTLIESRRAAGTAVLEHHNAVLGCLRRSGFSVTLAANAFSVLDSYVFGFVLTEQHLPFEAGEKAEDFAAELALPVKQYPYMVEMIAEMMIGRDYAYGNEFEHGLELILDGLAGRLAAKSAG